MVISGIRAGPTFWWGTWVWLRKRWAPAVAGAARRSAAEVPGPVSENGDQGRADPAAVPPPFM